MNKNLGFGDFKISGKYKRKKWLTDKNSCATLNLQNFERKAVSNMMNITIRFRQTQDNTTSKKIILLPNRFNI